MPRLLHESKYKSILSILLNVVFCHSHRTISEQLFVTYVCATYQLVVLHWATAPLQWPRPECGMIYRQPSQLQCRCLHYDTNSKLTYLWSLCVADADIIFSSCGFFFLLPFFPSPNLSSREWMSFYTWCGLSANLECRSEICCTRLAGNKG